ncbi:MAG: ABC transporter permease [Planctomycetota bacterium]
MASYILRRILQAPLVLLVLVTCTFFLMRLAPGGPFDDERERPPAVEAALQAKYHLDEPVAMQYLRYIGDLLRGDLGPSFSNADVSVNRIIATFLPSSLLLGGMALGLACAIGLAAGVVAAVRRGTWLDYGTMTVSMLGLSVPPFVTGPILILLVAMWAGLLPPAGYGGMQHLILPAFTLALPFAGRIARLCRAGMLEVLEQDFVRTARAKGLPVWRVVLVHALPGGLVPVLGFLGPAVAALLTGSVVVEMIFQIPGLGRAFVDGALDRDYTLVMGAVLVYGLLLVISNLLADLAYGLLDPRIRMA